MSPDERRRRDGGSPDGGRSNELSSQDGAGALGPGLGANGGAVVSRLPVPPNARFDGLDVRAARLAAFVVGEVDGVDRPAAVGSRPAGDTLAALGTSDRHDRGAQLLAASRLRDARRKQVRRRAGASLAVGTLAAAGLVAWTVGSWPAPALSYTIDGAAPSPGGIVQSTAGHEPQLAFSDGTNVRVLPRTRARVVEVGRRGARLMLEDGRAHVQVAHRPGADWQVQAGAYVIHVHGTAFFVEWSASQSRLDVQMESGVVSVDGPRPSDTLILRAGESLSVRPDGSRVVTAARAALAARAAPAVAQPAPAAPPSAEPKVPLVAPGVAPRATPSAASPSVPWSERLADGEAAAIIAEAHRRGVSSVLAGASSEDLAALADAARFRNQDQLARRALLAQRRRFQGTARAEEASFLLGRLADGPGGRPADARAWYERYLRDAPVGVYAAEAMGRMMLVLEREQRTSEARAVAAEYLRRFPQGPYARAARGLAALDR